jgi:uncharacterized membrane protein HdeD (DUF308 family)
MIAVSSTRRSAREGGGANMVQREQTAMSTVTHAPHSFGSEPSLAPLRAKSGWIVALGVVYVAAGVIALGSVVLATVASVFIVGIMMLVAGIAEVISAFQVKSWGKFLFWLLLGALYIVAGFLTFENPLLAAAVLTLLLGAALVVSGIMRMLLAFSMMRGTPWIWVLLSGAITFLIGLVIIVHWPVSGLYILGVFLGVDLILAGAGWIGLGLGLRRVTA